MEREYLIDTNVFIDIMANRYSPAVLDEIRKITSARFFISIVNKIEMLGFPHLSATDETLFNKIIKSSNIIHLHNGVIDETIAIRRKFTIKLPDAIVAASALSVDAILLTNNARDFRKISNLTVQSPQQLIVKS